MIPSPAFVLIVCCLVASLPGHACAQPRKPPPRLEPAALAAPQPLPFLRTATVAPDAGIASANSPPKSFVVGVLLGDVGYTNGFRLSNLGGRREIHIPVPQGVDLSLSELVLSFDDVSAHEARRSLEILANDRSVFAIALDGKSTARTIRIPLASVAARDGFLKLSFLYSGAATQDRCIDVRYVGDSLTVRPESAVEFEIGVNGAPTIAATAALMPQSVAILLSNPRLPPGDIAAALTLARSLAATGRKVTFHHGTGTLPELVRREDPRRWTRGLIVVGAFDRVAGLVDQSVALANAVDPFSIENTISTARIGGVPVLLVADAASARTGRLLGNPSLAALRDTSAASVGQVTTPKGPVDRVSFDELGLVAAQAEVFGRADLSVAIPNRILPSGTRPTRLVLDVMVAPDGAGEKAVVTTFVNERLLASTVAAIGEPTRLDFALPDGLVGTVANIRVVVQRRSAQGDCRFEPQGYPAELLGSSSVILAAAGSVVNDFSDLATLWASGVEVLLPASAATQPLAVIGLAAGVLNALSVDAAPIAVKFVEVGWAPNPGSPFMAVGDIPPAGTTQRVRFDRGRVLVTDRSARTRLDIGGMGTGAVVQIVASGQHPGLWIKPLARDGSLPAPAAVNLDRGDVAFMDKTGVALAVSTEREAILRVSYPDQESWLTFLERFRSWIVGGFWGVLTIAVLFVTQKMYRRRRAASAGE